MKLNLGCANQVVEGWTNVDYSLGARFAKVPLFKAINQRLRLFNMDWDKRIIIHDLRKEFPWKEGSVDVAYSSHTLEHLLRQDGRHFLRECHRVLKHGGLLRIVVPDLRSFVSHYLDGEIGADYFVEELRVLYGWRKSSFKRALAPFIEFPHQCMYDAPTLISICKEVGFECESKRPFESAIPDITQIELETRTTNAVIVEGMKT